ncbi:Uncharacterised protein [Mycobacteroides abscessus subsp. abscessus]|nr:Uncharacterised protein [Mycobacteroides abscessus subsp. abscessus]
METIAGSNCGVIPTAIANENSNASIIGRCSARLTPKMKVVNTAATWTKSIEKLRKPA